MLRPYARIQVTFWGRESIRSQKGNNPFGVTKCEQRVARLVLSEQVREHTVHPPDSNEFDARVSGQPFRALGTKTRWNPSLAASAMRCSVRGTGQLTGEADLPTEGRVNGNGDIRIGAEDGTDHRQVDGGPKTLRDSVPLWQKTLSSSVFCARVDYFLTY